MLKNITLFYRDGSNYKCNWDINIDSSILDKLEITLDPNFESDELLEIEQLGLSVNDIPMIKEYGFGDDDHNFISIVSINKKGGAK